jgi:pilus assembly protein CpaB
VAIAKRELEPGKGIEQADLAMVAFPENVAPHSSFQKASDLIGRVVLYPVAKDQPVLENALAPIGAGAGPQALVPKGMRAVTLDVSESTGVGGLLAPGFRVDVVSTLQDETGNKKITRTIVENVCVMAVGQRFIGSKKDDEGAPQAKTVTLLVTPQQAELIELASNSGRCRLVMRGLLDAGTGADSAATLAELLGPYATRPPVAGATTRPVVGPSPVVTTAQPPKPARYTMEIISNGKSTVVEFEPGKTLLDTALTGDGEAVQQVIPKQP